MLSTMKFARCGQIEQMCSTAVVQKTISLSIMAYFRMQLKKTLFPRPLLRNISTVYGGVCSSLGMTLFFLSIKNNNCFHYIPFFFPYFFNFMGQFFGWNNETDLCEWAEVCTTKF